MRARLIASGFVLVALAIPGCGTESTTDTASMPVLSTRAIVGRLELPWDMAFLEDGTMFFTEKCRGLSVRLPSGEIRKLYGMRGSSGYAASSEDLFCEGQGGMMGVAVDPDFATNRAVFVYSSAKFANGPVNLVMRVKVDPSFSKVSERSDIVADIAYKSKASNHPFGGPGSHNGGRIRFSPADGYLYITTGDNHKGIAPTSPVILAGKILRVDRDGKAAPGNQPPPGFDPRVFTFGHRNPQGIAFRPGDNRPFAAEHGPWHSDEVTALVNGGNAGWDPRPNMAGRAECPDDYCGYSPNQMAAMDPRLRAEYMPMTDLQTYPDAMRPAWNNNGLSQGLLCNTFLSGAKWKAWDGRMVVGFSGIGIHGTPFGNRLDVLKISADGLRATSETVSWPTAAGRFRSAVQGPDGNLYVAIEDQGVIYRVTPE